MKTLCIITSKKTKVNRRSVASPARKAVSQPQHHSYSHFRRYKDTGEDSVTSQLHQNLNYIILRAKFLIKEPDIIIPKVLHYAGDHAEHRHEMALQREAPSPKKCLEWISQ